MTHHKSLMRRSSAAVLIAALAFGGISPAIAGEITGNGTSLKNEDGTLNGASLCAFSGQNDSPNGQWLPYGVQIDPGGQVQSFGYFYAQQDFGGDPSDPGTRSSSGFPANGGNPTVTGGH